MHTCACLVSACGVSMWLYLLCVWFVPGFVRSCCSVSC